MTLERFKATLQDGSPPLLPPLLLALWHDARGEWDEAHRVAQEVDDRNGAWVHAYLHRKEGDLGNAAYWYGRADQPITNEALAVEWERIAAAVLGGTSG